LSETVTFNFEELVVYQKAIDFAGRIYFVTKKYPRYEIFGLTTQFQKAAVSIPLNVAEGSAKTKRDFCRFLDMARGSVYECVAILQISRKQNYITKRVYDEIRGTLAELSKMLSGLKRSLS